MTQVESEESSSCGGLCSSPGTLLQGSLCTREYRVSFPLPPSLLSPYFCPQMLESKVHPFVLQSTQSSVDLKALPHDLFLPTLANWGQREDICEDLGDDWTVASSQELFTQSKQTTTHKVVSCIAMRT